LSADRPLAPDIERMAAPDALGAVVAASRIALGMRMHDGMTS
jgi:hypothetical protein